jgi:hypothetical protein
MALFATRETDPFLSLIMDYTMVTRYLKACRDILLDFHQNLTHTSIDVGILF